MNKRIEYTIACAMMLFSFSAVADDGTHNSYSPYSKFGIGTINKSGSAYTRSMGGTGVATRDHRYINNVNPAAVTARDSLAFMVDFSVSEDNVFSRQGDVKSISNTFNISNMSMTFPIWRSSAMILGINPYSSVGYDFLERLTDKNVIGYTDNISDTYSGFGSIYEAYAALGATFWKRISVGVQGNFYFGTLEKSTSRSFSSSYQRSIYAGSQMTLRGLNAKFGLQYEQPVGANDRIIVGATYKMKANLNGENKYTSYTIQSDITDTLKVSDTGVGVNIPSEFAVGLSYTHSDKWRAEVNYSRSDWTASQMDKVKGFATGEFKSSIAQEFSAGFEYTPNRSDIRYYFRKCSYRLGAYYRQEHYTLSGNQVFSQGITLGMTLPVFKWYNGITVAADFGQRGSIRNSMIRERYFGVSVGMNIFDIWFIKHQYQ